MCLPEMIAAEKKGDLLVFGEVLNEYHKKVYF